MPITKLRPEFDRIVSQNQAIEELSDGYGGDGGPAEGPLWWKDGGYLLFSEIHNNRRMKWEPVAGVTTFRRCWARYRISTGEKWCWFPAWSWPPCFHFWW